MQISSARRDGLMGVGTFPTLQLPSFVPAWARLPLVDRGVLYLQHPKIPSIRILSGGIPWAVLSRVSGAL